MSDARWSEVDRYICDQLVKSDPILDAALSACDRAGLPEHNVAPNQGKLLMLLAQLQGARRILEIGTLGGYSTIWLARALAANGQLDSLEVDPAHVAVAKENIARANLAARVRVHQGPASDTLAKLVEQRRDGKLEAYDFIFIDADKPSNPDYLKFSLELSRPGSTIVVDNVIREGAVADEASDDPKVLGVRRMHE